MITAASPAARKVPVSTCTLMFPAAIRPLRAAKIPTMAVSSNVALIGVLLSSHTFDGSVEFNV